MSEEINPDSTRCRDCGVPVGQLHEEGCDVARCANTGRQRLQCACTDDCRTTWTGRWPGKVECEELGWYTKWTGRGWEQSDPHDRDASPDLNRLALAAARGQIMWNRTQERYTWHATPEGQR